MSAGGYVLFFVALYLLGAAALLAIALGSIGASAVKCARSWRARARLPRIPRTMRLAVLRPMSVGEMLGITAVLALDFAWFPRWAAIVLAPVIVLAMRHLLRQPLRPLEVLSAVATVIAVRASFICVEQRLIPPWYSYEQYVGDCVVLTLLFLCGLLYSMLSVTLSERALQVIATAVLTAILTLLLDDYQRYFHEKPPVPVLFMTIVPTVLLARYREKYNLQVWPSKEADNSLLDRLLRIVLASCLIVVTWLTYVLVFPRRLW